MVSLLPSTDCSLKSWEKVEPWLLYQGKDQLFFVLKAVILEIGAREMTAREVSFSVCSDRVLGTG